MLKALPSSRVPEYTRVVVIVRKWSTIPVAGHIDSVPSRLIGHEVTVPEIHIGVPDLQRYDALLAAGGTRERAFVHAGDG